MLRLGDAELLKRKVNIQTTIVTTRDVNITHPDLIYNAHARKKWQCRFCGKLFKFYTSAIRHVRFPSARCRRLRTQ